MARTSAAEAAAFAFDTFADLLPESDDPAFRSPSLDGRTLSHRELRRFVVEQESLLASFGISQGDRVCAVLPNGPECAMSFLAFSRSCAWAPLNAALTAEEIAFEFEDLPAKALVVQPECTDVSVAHRIASEMRIPTIELRASRRGLGCFTLEWLQSGGLPPPLPAVPPRPPTRPDVCLVIHTSGTTAKPKIVPLNHENLAVGALCIKSTLKLTTAAHNLNIMPLFHIHGISINLLASLLSGASVTPTPGLGDGSNFARWILGAAGSAPVTWFSCVPTLHALILKVVEGTGRLKGHSVGFCRSESSALPLPLAQRIEAAFSAVVAQTYAMTESMPIAANPPDGDRKMAAVGPSAGPLIRILNDDGSAVGAPQGEGEICVHGPCVTLGYEYRSHMKADPNLAAFHHESTLKGGSRPWLRTGDKGFFDADGYLQLSGRFKEIINRGGEKISPIEIEHVIRGHPALDDMVCFAAPHAVLGEVVGVAIVPKPSAAVPSLAALREYGAAAGLADKWLPELVHVLDEVPKGMTGKPARIGLAKKLGIAEIGTSAPPPGGGGNGGAPKFDSMAIIGGEKGDGDAPASKNMAHFTGLSAGLALWVVLFHFLPSDKKMFSFEKNPASFNFDPSPLSELLGRAPFAMLYFAILSGFSVHLSHADSELTTLRQCASFWRGRLDRICVTLWFGYAIIYGVVLAHNGNLRPLINDDWNQISVGRVLQLLFCPLSLNLNASLMGDISQCTNEPAWFVGAMLPSWLAYPLFQRLLRAVGSAGAVGYIIFATVLWVLTLTPYLFVHPVNPGLVSTYESSPLIFGLAFLIGAATAGLVQLHSADTIMLAGALGEGGADAEREPLLPGGARKAVRVEAAGPCGALVRAARRAPLLLRHYLSQRAMLRGLAADASLIGVLAALGCLTDAQMKTLGGGQDPAYARSLCIPFYAIFVYGSSAQGGVGLCAAFFSHPAFVLLGKYNLQAYLLQGPWSILTDFKYSGVSNSYWIGATFRMDITWTARQVARPVEYFVLFLIGLWVFTGLFTELIEEPTARWLRGAGANSCSCFTGLGKLRLQRKAK